jgi:hypothetical protein
MPAKLTRLTHKVAIQPHLVAGSCKICSSRSRWPGRRLSDTPSYDCAFGETETPAAEIRTRDFRIQSWNVAHNVIMHSTNEGDIMSQKLPSHLSDKGKGEVVLTKHYTMQAYTVLN